MGKNMKLVYKIEDYKKEIEKKVINIEGFRNFAKSYKESNKNDTATKMIDRFILAVASKKISNEDLNKFDYLANVFVIEKTDRQKINNIDKLTLKKTLQNIYNHCQKMAVKRTATDTAYKYNFDMVHLSGYALIRNMFMYLLQTTKVVNKPPKKEKAKKTAKK